jgi:hypothetical protein
VEGDSASGDFGISISADGRFVAFGSFATNLVAGDTNAVADLFVRDRQSGTTERMSLSSGGGQGDLTTGRATCLVVGRFLAFVGGATNLVAGDTNGTWDVFVRDRGTSPPGTDRCLPGAGGVLACPCSNPPSGPGRGCDNQDATGGASIISSGSNSLANPTLVFTTAGENGAVTSILLQGNLLTTGVVFGHGVRCLGPFKRMYTMTSAGGSVTLPNLATGPSIPTRSAALGDPILPAQKRWYQVYYEDTTLLLTGCPLAATQFNATNAQEVLWLP